jgi:hypothetical protein
LPSATPLSVMLTRWRCTARCSWYTGQIPPLAAGSVQGTSTSDKAPRLRGFFAI